MDAPVSRDRLQSNECAEKLKAIADPLRLRIVDLLREGELTVGEIAEKLAHDHVGVSHHLGILFQAGILEREKRGRFVAYRVSSDILTTGSRSDDYLDFGCCRLQVPKE